MAVVGLGYVGYEVAKSFAEHHETVGYDIDEARVQTLLAPRSSVGHQEGVHPNLHLTTDPSDLSDCNIFIIAVPTPVDRTNRPDLTALLSATQDVGEAIADQPVTTPPPLVIYESTVYPGCTEEVCVQELERASGREPGEGFVVGYSPERINPGDEEHTLRTVTKLVGAQDADTLDRVAGLYEGIIDAGVHRTPDIRTAEAAKIIENVQRDLNIALMNELAMLFSTLGLDTDDVLEAARTKWNFLDFRPGLVGGHCIPVDPYYLTSRAEEAGFHPQLIHAGRKINDDMARFVAEKTVERLARSSNGPGGTRALILGITFKPDVPDVRNSKALDLAHELERFGVDVVVHDPLVSLAYLRQQDLQISDDPFESEAVFDAVVVASPHKAFLVRGAKDYEQLLAPESARLLADVDGRLATAWGTEPSAFDYWRL